MRLSKQNPKMQYIMVLMSSGSTLVLGFVLNIIFTHAMETTEFGYYRAFVNSVTMFSTLTSLGFSLTFSRKFAVCKDLSEKKKWSGTAFAINIGISIGVFVLLLIGFFVLQGMGIIIPSYLILASSVLWLLLLNKFYLFRFQGENEMLMYSVLTAVPQLILTCTIVALFALRIHISGGVAIICYLLSYIIVIVFFVAKEVPSFKNVASNMPEILKENKEYGFQLYVGGLASVASTQLMNLMVAPLSGLEAYAHFTLGVSLASPIMQIPAIMGTISFKKNVTRNKIPTTQMLITLGMTAAAIVAYTIFLRYMLCWLIGEKYLNATGYATTMVYYYVLMGLGDYFNRFISAKGYGKEIRNSSFVVGGSLLVSAIIFVPIMKINGVIIAETISGLVYLLLMITKYFKVLKPESEDD